MKVVKALLRISQTGSTESCCTTLSARSGGFLLLDMALALTILLLLFSIIWPTFGRGTNSLRQSAIALDIASVLRSDRTAAGIADRPIGTRIDLNQRVILGANGRRVDIANDIVLEVQTGAACVAAPRQYLIVFSPDGSSCGGVIVLRKGRLAYAVRFNWLSGVIDIIHSS